ncbi:MAG: Na+/H+ antiporter NhaA [Sphingobacteriales bacterium]|nr:MAG: Na+/H+ antiporter NhaA [Sphingobacteriales bacterium]
MTNKKGARLILKRVLSPIREFIGDSRAVGITLICCTFVSLIISNSSWGTAYIHFWEKELHFVPSALHLPHSILHIINDALMTLFFFLVGLEIKRELLVGELSSIKKSMLPVMGAIGGMVVPALLYMLWCGGTPFSRGWAIPMATDIAFSLGVLSLLGKRAPLSLRIFLTALAIIDDLGGIVTIALFYTEDINWTYLFMAFGLVFVLSMMNVAKVRYYFFYFLLGIPLWYFVFNSGIHATIAGVLLALTIPMPKIEKLEHALHDPVNFIILPLFALANTAIILPHDFSFIFTSPIHYGVLMGLVLGKPIGIFLFGLASVKLRLADLQQGMGLMQLWGVGMIGGIGFTMSIFIAMLAFDAPDMQLIAKVAIIEASLLAGVLGYLFLKRMNPHR